jgi:Na+-driven multidrug efflux pump
VPIFTTDAAVRDLVWSLAVVVAASQPIGALLYVLDGILIGAGDTRYLAWTMLVALVVLLPLAGAVLVSEAGIIALVWALAGWLLARQVAVALRYRSVAWLRPGPAA